MSNRCATDLFRGCLLATPRQIRPLLFTSPFLQQQRVVATGNLEQAIQTTTASQTGEQTSTDTGPAAASPVLDDHRLLLGIVATLRRAILGAAGRWVVAAVVTILLVWVLIHHLPLRRRRLVPRVVRVCVRWVLWWGVFVGHCLFEVFKKKRGRRGF